MIRFLALLLTLVASATDARERITRFESAIEIADDGSMTVTETIDVQAEGNKIRRGIFRDFPTRYFDRLNHRVVVEFTMLGAKRDGKAETSKVEDRGNGVRIYLGNPNVLLKPGQYRYELRYRTNRQLGFFDEFDELYWNVTGNGWDLPIDDVVATLTLPADIPTAAWQLAAYTGADGQTGKNYSTQLIGPRTVQFETQHTLPPRNGLTIAAGWPKGIVQPPSQLARIGYFLRDNAGVLVAALGFFGVLGFYSSAWRRFGKDPRSGVIIPRYEPPKGYSPASLRYVWHMQYDPTCFSAALVNLAVNENLQIEQTKNWLQRKFSVKRLSTDVSDAHPGEQMVFRALLGSRASLKFEQKHQKAISFALTQHKELLRKEYLGKLFVRNGRHIGIATAASLAVGVATLLLGGLSTAVGAVLIGLLVILNFAFAFWMKAPTIEGRRIMDEIEGLKLYLGVAERQDLERQREPPQTFEEFERLLPFAVALDCASTWVDRFDSTLKALESSNELKSRAWYSGDTLSARGITSSIDGISSKMGATISSSATPPGSSSSGGGSSGGGFSGGGGGGGGGGGW